MCQITILNCSTLKLAREKSLVLLFGISFWKRKIPSEIKPPLNLDDIYEFASDQIHRLFPDDVKSEIQSMMEVDQDGDITLFEDSDNEKVVKKLTLHERAQLRWKHQQEKKKNKSAQKKPDFIIDLCKTYAKCT